MSFEKGLAVRPRKRALRLDAQAHCTVGRWRMMIVSGNGRVRRNEVCTRAVALCRKSNQDNRLFLFTDYSARVSSQGARCLTLLRTTACRRHLGSPLHKEVLGESKVYHERKERGRAWRGVRPNTPSWLSSSGKAWLQPRVYDHITSSGVG